MSLRYRACIRVNGGTFSYLPLRLKKKMSLRVQETSFHGLVFLPKMTVLNANSTVATYASCNHVTTDCPVSATAYGYTPSVGPNVILLSMSGLVTIAQLLQGIGWRTRGFMAAFVLGSLCEIIGYAGRLMLHSNPWNYDGFVLQMVCLTVGPIFFSAGLYLCYSRLVESHNKSMSRINLDIYPIISVACSILPFLLQVSGAAAIANNMYKRGDLTQGINLIIAGLSFQMLTLVLFGILCAEYAIRVHGQARADSEITLGTRSSKVLRFFWAATSLSSVLVMVRCIYQVTALSGGWEGIIMQSESKFLVLDGVMILAAGYVLSVVHPGYVFEQAPEINEKNFMTLSNE